MVRRVLVGFTVGVLVIVVAALMVAALLGVSGVSSQVIDVAGVEVVSIVTTDGGTSVGYGPLMYLAALAATVGFSQGQKGVATFRQNESRASPWTGLETADALLHQFEAGPK